MNDQVGIEWLKQQLIDLQNQLAFQEDTIQVLNDVVTRQQQQIEHLNELCLHNQSRMEQLAADYQPVPSQEPRPPHY